MAAKKKTLVDKLADTVSNVMSEYGNSVQANLDTITKKYGQKGAAALRQQSQVTFKQRTGTYAHGWKYAYRKTKRRASTTIYNEHFSRPHLLENDHVIRDGTHRVVGQYKGRKHIEPIANDLLSSFESEVISKL